VDPLQVFKLLVELGQKGKHFGMGGKGPRPLPPHTASHAQTQRIPPFPSPSTPALSPSLYSQTSASSLPPSSAVHSGTPSSWLRMSLVGCGDQGKRGQNEVG
jgi:hypothetical protein